jgi:hypothetical protein
MVQAKFSVREEQASFLDDYRQYGFKDKSSMLRAAIDHFKRAHELARLKKSAALYAEVYSEDRELQKLTETAANGWPE